MSGGVLPQPPELEAPGRIWPASDPAQDGGSLHVPTLCTLLLDFPWGSPPPRCHMHTHALSPPMLLQKWQVTLAWPTGTLQPPWP